MLRLIGAILTFMGGAVVLLPDISRLYNLLHHLPPFSRINNAEKKLFDERKELKIGDEGFEWIESAIMESSQPYDSTGEFGSFRKYGAQFPSSNGAINIDFDDCKIWRIEMDGEGFLSDSVCTVHMIPLENSEQLDSTLDLGEDMVSVIKTEIPNGRFPKMVREYKRSIVSKWAMICLVSGLVMLTADELL